jgi:hypothetical protein
MNEKIKWNSEDMKCTAPDLGNLFFFYLNDDITTDERKRIEEHLPLCKDCQEEMRLFAIAKEIKKEDLASANALSEIGVSFKAFSLPKHGHRQKRK